MVLYCLHKSSERMKYLSTKAVKKRYYFLQKQYFFIHKLIIESMILPETEMDVNDFIENAKEKNW